jgi:hypothetical protein
MFALIPIAVGVLMILVAVERTRAYHRRMMMLGGEFASDKADLDSAGLWVALTSAVGVVLALGGAVWAAVYHVG